ncbi:MAG TPA: maleylpyruvate isomerase N-terminal domain-containing protein [Ilumatobacteraceae bacterium]|nr:maleylpyruvate isomerase N-terminal domain-containing protein [Ilumatobacteraceae bacterium]
MPTSLSLDQHLTTLADSGTRLAAHVAATPQGRKVPTCPAWDATALMAHQAMVHRWATAQVRGEDPSGLPTQTALRRRRTLPRYYGEGLDGIVSALREAPADLQAMTFLNDAPAPREFWARRQAHETTMHMVDALAGSLDRVPSTAEAAVDRSVAIDGIDELLRGFFTRGRSKLFEGAEYAFVVAPDDDDRHWVVDVAERLSVRDGDRASVDGAVATLNGSAAALYLALWNRGSDVRVEGDGAIVDRWRSTQQVRWS